MKRERMVNGYRTCGAQKKTPLWLEVFMTLLGKISPPAIIWSGCRTSRRFLFYSGH